MHAEDPQSLAIGERDLQVEGQALEVIALLHEIIVRIGLEALERGVRGALEPPCRRAVELAGRGVDCAADGLARAGRRLKKCLPTRTEIGFEEKL
jgi:hypothetical protein